MKTLLVVALIAGSMALLACADDHPRMSHPAEGGGHGPVVIVDRGHDDRGRDDRGRDDRGRDPRIIIRDPHVLINTPPIVVGDRGRDRDPRIVINTPPVVIGDRDHRT